MKYTKQTIILLGILFIFCKTSQPEPEQGSRPISLEQAPMATSATPHVPAKVDQDELIAGSEEDYHAGLRLIGEVLGLIDQQAIRRIKVLDFVVEALRCAMPNVDPHSAFFSKKSYAETLESTSGKFSGIGVSILGKLPEDDGLTIVDVIEGGPAEEAGLEAGDIIIGVKDNGKRTLLRGLSADEAISKVKGPVGSSATVQVLRDKKLKEIEVKRDIIKHEISLSYLFKDQNVYYISLKSFTENATRQLRPLLEEATANKASGIILDLRRNPGGVLDVAIDIAGLFLKKKSLVSLTKDRNGNVINKYYTNTKPVFNSDIPIFILTDNFTASAAEILTGVLKHYSIEHDRQGRSGTPLTVFQIGEQTHGKGSVQTLMPVSYGCAIKITNMLYYLPNGETIQAAGIKPDFEIQPKLHPEEDLKMIKELFGREQDTKHHINREEVDKIDGKKPQPKEATPKEDETANKELSHKEKKEKALRHDNLIQTTLSMINVLDLAHKYLPKDVDTRKEAADLLERIFVSEDDIAIEKVKIEE